MMCASIGFRYLYQTFHHYERHKCMANYCDAQSIGTESSLLKQYLAVLEPDATEQQIHAKVA